MVVQQRPPALRSPRPRGGFLAARKIAAAARPLLGAYGLLGCGLLVVHTVEFDPLSPLLTAVLIVVLALAAATVAVLWSSRARWRRLAPEATVAAAGAYGGVAWAAALHATPYPPLGLAFDAGFRVQAVSRFTDTWRLADMAYQGLPAFYPPALPYVVGHTAGLAGLPPYLAWKYAIVAVAAAAPGLAYLLWRRLLPAGQAALVCLVVLVPQISVDLGVKPDEWLTLVLIVPWWLTAVYEIRRPRLPRGSPWLLGVVGGLLFCTYYYFYFILAIGLVLAPLLDRWHPPRPGVWRRRLIVLGVAAATSAVYWGPLLVSIVVARQPAFTQSQLFLDSHAELPLPMFTVSVLGVVLLAGLCHVIWTARRDPVSAGLVLLLAAGYLWYLAGLLAAAAHHPVLVQRGQQYIVLVLAVAGVRALALLGAYVPDRWAQPQARHVVTVVGLGLVVLLGQHYTTAITTSGQVEMAHNEPLPSGRLPRYHTADARAPGTASLATLGGVIRDEASGRGQPVVVSAPADLLDISGFYAFNQASAIYAHPAGAFRARLDLLRHLETIQRPQAFARLATDNRFDAIDAMVLRTTPDGLRYSANTVDFPHVSVPVRFSFDRGQFSPRFWRITTVDGYLTAVRQQPPPPPHGEQAPTPAGDPAAAAAQRNTEPQSS